MKRLTYIWVALALVALIMLSLSSACSSSTAQTKPSPTPAPTTNSAAQPTALPDVPVKYPGDTDASIARRAKLIEGAKKEGNLVIWGIIPPDTEAPMMAEFNKIYPFIKVNYWRGSGEESGTKIEAEAVTGKFDVDVDLGSIQMARMPVWRQNGWIKQWTDIIPNVKNLGGAISSNKDWALPGANVIGPQYNTDLVKAVDAPKSWEDLLDPKWKGKIGMAISTGLWESLAYSDGGWGEAKTLDYLNKLKAQNIVWLQGGYLGGHGLLVAGEVSIMANALLPHYIQAKAKGAPVDWVKANPLTSGGPDYVALNNSPNPNAAQLFLEWQFSPDGLVAYEKATAKGDVSPGSQTQLAKLLVGQKVIFTTEQSTLKVIDNDFINKASKAIGIPQ